MTGKHTIKILSVIILALLIVLNIVLWNANYEMIETFKVDAIEKATGIALMQAGQKDDRPFYVIDDKEEMNYRYQYQPIKGISQGHEEYIKVNGGTITERQYIIDLLSYIPQPFQDYCVKYGWHVEIVDSITEVENIKTIGKTSPKDKVVYITMDQPFTVYHEFGHILKWNLNNLPDSLESELSMLCCHSAYGSPYIYASKEEQCAECLYDYIWYPKEFKEQAPELYARIQKEVDEEPYKRYTISEE